MRVLALEAYYGGSHKAFVDGWRAHGRHEWTLLTLPASKWKWRMRHAAVTWALELRERIDDGERWDVLFCSDMLNLAEFLGLASGEIRALPSVIYYHENQLTYPNRHESEFDYHFVFTNMTSALAADRVWFNSGYHRDAFLGELPSFLKRMPDYQPVDVIERIRGKSTIQPPGISKMSVRGPRREGPLRICWAGRWEHDKDPETFFEAIEILKSKGIDFRLSVIGEQFREIPGVFEKSTDAFKEHIDRWGYQATREEYEAALLEADVIVSTAVHEFFGISVVEAIAAGAYPLLPRRLAYPEILGDAEAGETDEFFYDGSARQLADRLAFLAERAQRGDLWQGDPHRLVRVAEKYVWSTHAAGLDAALEETPRLRSGL